MNKFALPIAGVAFALSTQSASACGDVSITEMNWASGRITTAVSGFLMEQGYGCTVTKLPSSIAPAVTSVAETGKPDILTEVSVNSFPAFIEMVEDGRLLSLTNVLAGGLEEGWYLPASLVEEHPELATIDGVLANPGLVGGVFNNCPEGWGCRVKNDNLVKAFGFGDAGMEVFNHGSGETLAASIGSAVTDGDPWFGYSWSPSTAVGRFGLVAIDMGSFDADAYACVSDADCDNPQKTSYPASEVVTAVTPAFAEAEPEITELMRNVSFPNKVMAELLAWQDENDADADEAAAHFLTNYQDVWSGWVNDEAREKLSSLLQ